MKERILIVDDEVHIRTLLEYNLSAEGYNCIFAETGLEAIHMAELENPDLILLDWMMPEMSGAATCKKLQKNPDTASIPIIMLTARSEEIDKIKGLNNGADDYITKPFSPGELLARVRSVLRRSKSTQVSSKITYKDLVLDSQSFTVLYLGNPVQLSKKEFQLLQIFMENTNRVFEREFLLNRVWGMDTDVDERTVDVYIKRLRKNLGDAGSYIRTIRGIGYGL